MLEIKCDDYFKKVVEFAERKGLKKYLDQRLEYLKKYADREEKGLCRVELKKDFAPASFRIAWFKKTENGDYAYWFNGGLIFHGDQSGWDDSGTYVDPLSVLTGSDDNPWGIHT